MKKKSRSKPLKKNGDLLPLSESTGHLIKIVHRLYQRLLSTELAKHGLKISHWHFLRYLWEEDGITQRKLSRCIVIKESTAVAVVREMEADGLIRRERGESDRRKIFVHLTPKAKRMMRKLIPVADSVNACGIAGLSKKELRQYQDATRNIINRLEHEMGEPGGISSMSIGPPWEDS
jgi:DNA-binding MarR family transcriptional regulator